MVATAVVPEVQVNSSELELFGDTVGIPYIDLMVEKALEKRNTITLEELNQQIRFVKQKHTYINRINNILSIL